MTKTAKRIAAAAGILLPASSNAEARQRKLDPSLPDWLSLESAGDQREHPAIAESHTRKKRACSGTS